MRRVDGDVLRRAEERDGQRRRDECREMRRRQQHAYRDEPLRLPPACASGSQPAPVPAETGETRICQYRQRRPLLILNT